MERTRQIGNRQVMSIPSDASRMSDSVRSRDGVRIAYAICGRGSPLMRAAHWKSHLNYKIGKAPFGNAGCERCRETTKLVRYDERGNGLSDRDASNLAFEAIVEDLESIMSTQHNLDRFTLCSGVSQSCAVSAAYAALHPERLAGPILYGRFIRGWRKRGRYRHEIHAHEAMTTLICEGSARGQRSVPATVHDDVRSPGPATIKPPGLTICSGSPSPPIWRGDFTKHLETLDLSRVLAQITAPTFVLHATSDAVVPFNAGREFAAGIRGAQFLELKSANHILLANRCRVHRNLQRGD